jgi:Flp pilus assembly protein TadG
MILLSKLRSGIARLARNRSGLAMTEFALGAPFLLTAGLWGVELANFAVTNMKIGQIAVHIADNGSRIGDTSTLTTFSSARRSRAATSWACSSMAG